MVKALYVALIVIAAGAALCAFGAREPVTVAPASGETIWGTWYLSVDSTPFGIPGGTLPAMITIHQDGTLTISDAGDLASSPFTTSDTAQHGVWVAAGQTIQTTTLFLRKDEVSGEVEGWHRVHASLQFADRDHLTGLAEEEVLSCDPAGPTPFKLLNCPNPITSNFIPAPFPIPIQLTRLPAS